MNKYDCSVNCISWAPSEYGMILIAGLSSGKACVMTLNNQTNQWDQISIDAHDSSVNAISIFKSKKVSAKPEST
jgi:WD40 repeat protein